MRKKLNFPNPMLIGIIAAGSVAAGTALMVRRKREADAEKKAIMARFKPYRNAYRGVRTPQRAFITDDQIQFFGNKYARVIMNKNAKHRMQNLYGYKASIWDLEQFIK